MSPSFSLIDWTVIGAFLVLMLSIGVLAHRKVASYTDFLLVGRKLRSVWGIATLTSTEMGLITVIYFSEEAYVNGFVALATAAIAAIMMWIVGRTGFVIRTLRTLELRTVPEYFEGRFNRGVRWIAGVLTFLTGILNMGIFLQVEGRFLCIVFGLDPSALPIVMGVLIVIVVAYTILGGMYSVVLTDVLQFLLMAIGITLTTVFAIRGAGGWSGMVEAVDVHFGSAGFDLSLAPRYGLLFLIWTALYYLSGWSSWQPVVQRTLSMRSVPTALRLFRICSVFMFFRAAFPMVWGICALAVLGQMEPTQAALPELLVRVIPSGLVGLTLIGFLAASMSTYDSYLLSFSTILVQDIVGPLTRGRLSESQRMMLTRLGILIIAVVIYFWGVYYTFTDTVFRYITLTGSLSFAPILTVLVGGIYWKRASNVGAGFAFVLAAIPPLVALANPALSSTHAGLLSFLLAPAGLVVGSLVWPRRDLRPEAQPRS